MMLKCRAVLMAAVLCIGLAPGSMQHPIESESATLYSKRSPKGNTINSDGTVNGYHIMNKYQAAEKGSAKGHKWLLRWKAYNPDNQSRAGRVQADYEVKHNPANGINREAHIEAWERLAKQKYEAAQEKD